ncbi:putative ribonuclease H protein [Vitis vinifera]|uniref:Putative ribonuclease H protein n=1 Tax=Vitis vinifera TaxID=29760 RepID=A0A438E012_VITVI|nr:putative ribonuclease H protein [Vitis vinifera]
MAVNISHLLFADDTIVFCEAKKESLLYLSWILLWFEAASGLKINLEKSMVIPVGEVEGVLDMAAEIGLARRLEKLQRNFLWGGANGGNKAHLIKWEVVCTDKKKGGLGLRKLIWLNKALLSKWIWRFARAKEELWKKVLEAKYGQEEFGWRTRKANGVFGVGVWKEILKESLGVGKTWCSRWEKAIKFGSLEGEADGLFKVKEAYRVLTNTDEAVFPHSNVWVDKVPTKIVFFAWEATWGRFLHWIGCREEDGISLTGASCVDVKRKLSIIC